MRSLLFWVPYVLVFIVDKVQAFRGVSNPVTWRKYVGLAITALLSFLVYSAPDPWGDIFYFSIWGIGYTLSYLWNNSADTSGDGF